MIVIVTTALCPGTAAAASAWVSSEQELLEAVADVSVDTIYVVSPLNLTASDGVTLGRSVTIQGNCGGAGDPGAPGCTLIVGGGGSSHAFLVRAVAHEISVCIRGLEFSASQGQGNRGAISCGGTNTSQVLIEDSSFHGLSAEDGGALLITRGGCAVTCNNCGFSGNEAVDAGGAVHVQGGTFMCLGCAFAGNRAKRGGAVHMATRGQAEIWFSSFSDNVATEGGPDIFIDDASFAFLSFCPASPYPPDTTGSGRAPMATHYCAANVSSHTVPFEVGKTTATTTLISSAVHSGGSGGRGLFLRSPSGVSQVSTGYPFTLQGMLVTGTQTSASANVNLTIGQQGQTGSSCSGFILETVTPSQGSCDDPTDHGGCSVSCDLGILPMDDPVSLDMSLRALAVGSRLAVNATVLSLGGGVIVLPGLFADASGVPTEPVRAVDATRPILVPQPGAELSTWRPLQGGRRDVAFVATRGTLRFSVLGPGLEGPCNLTEAIVLDGPGRVVNVTRSLEPGSLMAFEVLASPDSVIVLQVAEGACQDADGQPSLASEPFPVLVDFSSPSVTVTRVSGRPVKDALVIFRIQFSERVTGFSEKGVRVSGGDMTCLSPVNEVEGTYEAIVRPSGIESSSFFLSVEPGAAVDVAGNPCAASTESANQGLSYGESE